MALTTTLRSVSERRPGPASGTAAERAALVALLVMAAALRFVGIDRDFEFYGPSFDELHNFIQPVHWMWQRGTADPHVYSGYPGFFNYLIFFPVTLARELGGLEAAYVAARGVVATCGVVNVALVWVIGRAAFGPAAALLGACLITLSRSGIREAHHISPDVLVATLLLTIFLIQERGAGSRRGDLASGALLGLATGVKYTGLLLAPALLASLAVGGRLRRRLLPVLAAAALSFALAAPYAVFHRDDERGTGLMASLLHYYGPETARGGAPADERLGLRALMPALHFDLGSAAVLLGVFSFALWRPRIALAAPAATIAASLAAMAPATMTFPRHALVPLAGACVLVMAGFAGVLARLPARRLSVTGPVIAAAVLAMPVARSWSLFARQLRPSPPRQAQGWLEERVPGPSRVATSLYGLPLPRDRFEVRSRLALSELSLDLLRHYDAVVAREGELAVPDSWGEAARFAADETPSDLLVLRPPGRRLRQLAAAPAAITASPPGADPALAFDGRGATAWRAGPGRGWIEARWQDPIRVERVEVDALDDASHWPQRWLLFGAESGAPTRLTAPRLRPRFGQLRGRAPGQIFVLTPPRPLTALRLVRERGQEWSVAEIRIYVAEPPAGG